MDIKLFKEGFEKSLKRKEIILNFTEADNSVVVFISDESGKPVPNGIICAFTEHGLYLYRDLYRDVDGFIGLPRDIFTKKIKIAGSLWNRLTFNSPPHLVVQNGHS